MSDQVAMRPLDATMPRLGRVQVGSDAPCVPCLATPSVRVATGDHHERGSYVVGHVAREPVPFARSGCGAAW